MKVPNVPMAEHNNYSADSSKLFEIIKHIYLAHKVFFVSKIS